MQTFLPYEDFTETAKSLDYRRLGKMRVEAWQILRASLGLTKGWVSHPATIMWSKYRYALCQYGIAMCDEWISRGYKDTMRDRFLESMKSLENTGLPAWLGNPDFHISHQSNLLRKDPEFYKLEFPDVPDNLEYVWPTS